MKRLSFVALALASLVASCVTNVALLHRKNAKLEELVKSNNLIAEETRELTEAIHANNRLLEIVEGAGAKPSRIN